MTLRWSKSLFFYQCTSLDRFSSICLPCAAVLPKPDGFPFSLVEPLSTSRRSAPVSTRLNLTCAEILWRLGHPRRRPLTGTLFPWRATTLEGSCSGGLFGSVNHYFGSSLPRYQTHTCRRIHVDIYACLYMLAYCVTAFSLYRYLYMIVPILIYK